MSLGFCALLLTVSTAFADTLVLPSGGTVSGTVLQTNGDSILLLADDGAFVYSRASLKEIQCEPRPEPATHRTTRLPDFREALLALSGQNWATNITPIPATVIDKGVLKNVPYSSFHCGEDYEVNVYGDPEHPAGLEIGVYRKLLNDPNARTNCLKFISGLLPEPADKQLLWSLNQRSDYKNLDDLTFEVTPPTDTDAFNGWWISVYSEADLSRARATDAELSKISVTKTVAAEKTGDTNNLSGWSAADLKAARPSVNTITFVNSAGEVVSNATVVRVINGVSLIYQTGPTSGGMVRLADLPEDLQQEFGYDPAKTAAADASAKAQKDQWQKQLLAAQQAQAAAAVQPDPGYYGGGYYGGGRVYVHGYTRRDGTYVQAYTRRR